MSYSSNRGHIIQPTFEMMLNGKGTFENGRIVHANVLIRHIVGIELEFGEKKRVQLPGNHGLLDQQNKWQNQPFDAVVETIGNGRMDCDASFFWPGTTNLFTLYGYREGICTHFKVIYPPHEPLWEKFESIEGDQWNGAITYRNGDRYTGWVYAMDKQLTYRCPFGKGCYEWNDGSIVEGQWEYRGFSEPTKYVDVQKRTFIPDSPDTSHNFLQVQQLIPLHPLRIHPPAFTVSLGEGKGTVVLPDANKTTYRGEWKKQGLKLFFTGTKTVVGATENCVDLEWKG